MGGDTPVILSLLQEKFSCTGTGWPTVGNSGQPRNLKGLKPREGKATTEQHVFPPHITSQTPTQNALEPILLISLPAPHVQADTQICQQTGSLAYIHVGSGEMVHRHAQFAPVGSDHLTCRVRHN